MKQIKSDRLKLDFIELGEYVQARFDWCGIIEQITLDDKYTFGTTEKENRPDYKKFGGIGLCNEFGLDGPLGLEENLDYFMKIGVGEVVRGGEPPVEYIHKDDTITPDVKSEFTQDTATFTLTQSSDNGYAYEYTKHIKVIDNTIEVYLTVKNIGERFIDTKEYYHNFINVNNIPLGSTYTMTVDHVPESWVRRGMGQLQINDNNFTFDEDVNEVFYARTDTTKGMTSWKITESTTGITVSEKCQNEVTRFATWGLGHVYSCELFADVKIATGETYTNKRTFTFEY